MRIQTFYFCFYFIHIFFQKCKPFSHFNIFLDFKDARMIFKFIDGIYYMSSSCSEFWFSTWYSIIFSSSTKKVFIVSATALPSEISFSPSTSTLFRS